MIAAMRAILVVEDEALIAMDLAGSPGGGRLPVCSAPPIRPRPRWRSSTMTSPMSRLLDVNLGRSDAFGVANVLTERKTQMIFLTGHTAHKLPPAHRHLPLVSKPYLPQVLLQAVERARANSATSHALRRDALKPSASLRRPSPGRRSPKCRPAPACRRAACFRRSRASRRILFFSMMRSAYSSSSSARQ